MTDRIRALSRFYLRQRELDKKTNVQVYLFDYNSVELVMLGSAICVCATGIMFTSGNFVGRPDLQVRKVFIAYLELSQKTYIYGYKPYIYMHLPTFLTTYTNAHYISFTLYFFLFTGTT